MTDRYSALLVTLKEPIREDDLEAWRAAILLMRDVVSVEPAALNDIEFTVARQQALHEIRDKVRDLLWPRTMRD